MIRLCALSFKLFSYIIVLVFLFVGLLTFRTLQCDWKALLAAWDVQELELSLLSGSAMAAARVLCFLFTDLGFTLVTQSFPLSASKYISCF